MLRQGIGTHGSGRFDVVIVGFRSNDALARCISSVFEHEDGEIAGITVVENGEEPLPIDLTRRFSDVRWIENKKNRGFAAGCNQGMACGNAPFICLINPDAEVALPMFRHVADLFNASEKTGIIGPLVLDSDGKVQGSARSFPSLLTSFFGRNTLLSRLFPSNPLTRANVLNLPEKGKMRNKPLKPDWISGACMFVRRKAVETVGGLDEGFFIYWEDADWCRRFWENGWEVVYNPNIGPVIHQCGMSSSQAEFFSSFHFHRSAVRFYWKYDKSPFKIVSLPVFAGAALRFMLICIYGKMRTIKVMPTF